MKFKKSFKQILFLCLLFLPQVRFSETREWKCINVLFGSDLCASVKTPMNFFELQDHTKVEKKFSFIWYFLPRQQELPVPRHNIFRSLYQSIASPSGVSSNPCASGWSIQPFLVAPLTGNWIHIQGSADLLTSRLPASTSCVSAGEIYHLNRNVVLPLMQAKYTRSGQKKKKKNLHWYSIHTKCNSSQSSERGPSCVFTELS